MRNLTNFVVAAIIGLLFVLATGGIDIINISGLNNVGDIFVGDNGATIINSPVNIDSITNNLKVGDVVDVTYCDNSSPDSGLADLFTFQLSNNNCFITGTRYEQTTIVDPSGDIKVSNNYDPHERLVDQIASFAIVAIPAFLFLSLINRKKSHS